MKMLVNLKLSKKAAFVVVLIPTGIGDEGAHPITSFKNEQH